MLIEVPVTFRLCEAEDLSALEWMGLYSRQREIIAGTFAAQQRGEALILLAMTNDFPIGQAWLDFATRGTRDCPRLWAVRVFHPLQGRGLGTALMAEAEALAARHGARRIMLGVEWDNEDARRFYARLGYTPSGEEEEEVRYRFEDWEEVTRVEQQLMQKTLVREPEPAEP